MNNNRPRDKKKRAPDNEKLWCFFVVQGERTCPHGENGCKFCHDVDEYSRTKPQDVYGIQGGRCPSFRSQVLCRYGICCRHAASHNTKTGSNINNNIKNDEIKTTLNILDHQVLTQLRKNQFPYICRQIHFKTTNQYPKPQARSFRRLFPRITTTTTMTTVHEP